MPQPFTLTPSPQQNMEAFNVPTSLITTPPTIQPSAPAVMTSQIAKDQLNAFNKTMLQANQAMATGDVVANQPISVITLDFTTMLNTDSPSDVYIQWEAYA